MKVAQDKTMKSNALCRKEQNKSMEQVKRKIS